VYSPPLQSRTRGVKGRSGISAAGVSVPARSSADTEIMSGRAEDEALLGSSPRSPLDKKTCVGRPSSPLPDLMGWTDPAMEQSLPQRQPRQSGPRLDTGIQSATTVAAEIEMADAAEGGGDGLSPRLPSIDAVQTIV